MANRFSTALAAGAARTASLLGPRTMRLIARFNRRVTNPIQRLWASRLPYLAVIEHTGRTSGRRYRTPVMAFVENGTLSVVLNYGAESDWVRNVRAAGSASVVHRGRRYRLTSPRVLPAGSPELPAALPPAGDPPRDALHATLTPETPAGA
ncbi:nitroreductase family deazaflavin-dependent oxidoreductase [Actinocorallia longicatena]|uniref:Deazaflavin-dependent oxidoreductase (Nitroreductase family) n=1 Tax=Actinocorallia longicatena TaxID=111803 RepID=A0ABP6QQK5_9ACTN